MGKITLLGKMYKLFKNWTAVCTLSERGHGGKKSTFNKSVDITVAARRKLWFSEFESTKIQEEVYKPFLFQV